MFDCQWIEQHALVSIDNDGGLFFWNLAHADLVSGIATSEYSIVHRTSTSFRCLSPLQGGSKFAAVTGEGMVKVFDAASRFSVVREVVEESIDGAKCCSLNGQTGLLVIGAATHLACYDARSNAFSTKFDCHDPWGIRSISTEGYRVTYCTGSGCILFADLRMGTQVQVIDSSLSSLPVIASPTDDRRLAHGYLATGGFVEDSEIRRHTYGDAPLPCAVFAHEWDSTGTRLFVGGGPAIRYINGSYASIWM